MALAHKKFWPNCDLTQFFPPYLCLCKLLFLESHEESEGEYDEDEEEEEDIDDRLYTDDDKEILRDAFAQFDTDNRY